MFPNSQSSDFDVDHDINAHCKTWFRHAVKVCSRKLLQSNDSNIWKTIVKMFQLEASLQNSKQYMFLDPDLLTTDNCREFLTNVVNDYVQTVPKVPQLREEVFYLHSLCFTFLNVALISLFIVLLNQFYKSRKPLARIHKKTLKNIQRVCNKAGRFNMERSMCETKLFKIQSLRNIDNILEYAPILTTKVTRKKFVQTLAMSIRPHDGSGDDRYLLKGKLQQFLSSTSKCCVILSFELEDSLEYEEELVAKTRVPNPPKYLHEAYARPRFMSHGSGDGNTTPPTKKICLLRSSKCSADYDSTSMKSDCSAFSAASTNFKRTCNYRMKNPGTPTSTRSKEIQSPRPSCNTLSHISVNRSLKSRTQLKNTNPNLYVTKKYKDS